MNYASVLIVSDDTEFARTITARWQSEGYVPSITIATSDVWRAPSSDGYDLTIVGPVHDGKRARILTSLSGTGGAASVCVTDEQHLPSLHAEFPNLLLVPMQDGWPGTLILVSIEVLRRVDAAARAQNAERQALAAQNHATLGRYMLEMRPSVNNALTSVLGNADLLLLEPGLVSSECREQIQTIHTMALRLNEIMQRFSSLAAEMRLGEKDSQAETDAISGRLVGR